MGAKNNFDNRVKIASSIYYIRWNNIQQTVVPPICQISFIANLGQAVAKGADIQADMALTDNFTAELPPAIPMRAIRKDSMFSPVRNTPVVAKGDAIVGQSGRTARAAGHLFTLTRAWNTSSSCSTGRVLRAP